MRHELRTSTLHPFFLAWIVRTGTDPDRMIYRPPPPLPPLPTTPPTPHTAPPRSTQPPHALTGHAPRPIAPPYPPRPRTPQSPPPLPLLTRPSPPSPLPTHPHSPPSPPPTHPTSPPPMRRVDCPETGAGVLEDVLRLYVGGVRVLSLLAQPPLRPPRVLLHSFLGGRGVVDEDSPLQGERKSVHCCGQLEGVRAHSVWLFWGNFQCHFREVSRRNSGGFRTVVALPPLLACYRRDDVGGGEGCAMGLPPQTCGNGSVLVCQATLFAVAVQMSIECLHVFPTPRRS